MQRAGASDFWGVPPFARQRKRSMRRPRTNKQSRTRPNKQQTNNIADDVSVRQRERYLINCCLLIKRPVEVRACTFDWPNLIQPTGR
jgi:hypothetical protein